MGAAIAMRLLQTGNAVLVWNRTSGKAEPLLAYGAEHAQSPAELARCELVITVLADGTAVSDVLVARGLAQAMRPGGLLVDLSSIAPEEARDHARQLGARGVRHLDAPVSGGPGAASSGELAIMVGGDDHTFRLAQPILRHLGRPVRVGPSGAGQVAKLANQLIVAANIAGVAEALLLAKRGGADPAAVRNAIRGGFAESRVLDLHGQRMLARNFEPGGRSAIQLKDLDNALRLVGQKAPRSPLLHLLRNLFAELCAHGGADLDHSALFLELERDAQPSARSRK
jgi:2-hydroxy-3-oxopropionate reductase